jgi:hypothetical protein
MGYHRDLIHARLCFPALISLLESGLGSGVQLHLASDRSGILPSTAGVLRFDEDLVAIQDAFAALEPNSDSTDSC